MGKQTEAVLNTKYRTDVVANRMMNDSSTQALISRLHAGRPGGSTKLENSNVMNVLLFV